MSAFVWGAGSSVFGKQPQTSTAELAWEAVAEAVGDAGIQRLDAVYVGSCFGEPGVAQRVLAGLGMTGMPVYALENACASSSTAFHEARIAVESGRFRTALVLGVDHLTSRFAGAIPVESRDIEGRTGLALPALYAMSATRYMAEHDLTLQQLASVSVKNHRHGAGNPRAQHGASLTVEDVLSSRMIAEPLTLLQCCGVTDAAAAVIVGDHRRGAGDVEIRSTAYLTGGLWDHESGHVWGFELARDTAAEVYEVSGMGPEDIDMFEVHDAFTIGEIVTTEALGLAPVGGGGELVESGRTSLGGTQPVNPSGGLLSRGHPLGATGVAQIAEAVWQLRGHADGRQVEGAQSALVETLGGGVGGIDGNACVVSVLSR